MTASCNDSPFEPRGDGERVPVGLVIEHEVSDSANWYSFAAGANQLFVVFLQALQGTVSLAAFDSTHGTLVFSMGASAGGPALEENASGRFGTPGGGVYQLRVTAYPPGTGARFRFKVYAIDRAPERVPAAFAFGDTVTGETIEPSVDLDQFLAHGDSGQEVVAVAETPGPAGSGSVALSVIDPVGNSLLGYHFADAGTTNRLTTGRMRLPGTHDYQFTFGSVTSNQYPLYRGPYRFWTYVINRAPEHRAATIPFDAEISNERIDRAGDVDEFVFLAAADGEYNAFVQGGGRTFQLEVARPGGTTFAIASSHPNDTALFAHATNRFRVTDPGTHVMRVLGANPYQVADTGAYRVYLYAIDPRPEHVPATITPGDTVTGENIGLPGDVDEFTFNGAAGEEFNVFLQGQSGSPETRLQLEVVNGIGTVLRTVESAGTDTSLLRQVTGRFALPTAGPYRLRVSGVRPYGVAHYRGPYRLFLYRVNRRPESLPDTLAFGDSVSAEAMDVPGDVDEFRVRVRDSSGANLMFELERQPVGGSLSVQLIDSLTGQIVASGFAHSTGRGGLGRIRLAPGTYVVRADGNRYEDQSVMQGGYRIWFYGFSYGPEVAADTFAIGDTVSGEAIEPLGDEDDFHFHGTRGQHINVLLQGLSAPSGGGFEAFIDGPGGYAIVWSPTAAAALADHQTLRIDLPATGWYHIFVRGAGWTEVLAERGPYRFAVEAVGTAPEHVSGALSPGDSVTTEAIDTPGDWDEYLVSAAPGRDLGLIVRSDRTDFRYPLLRVLDPATRDSLHGTVVYGERFAGPFRVPSSGQVLIAVAQPGGFYRFCYDATCGGVFGFVGSYAFHVIPIDRAPENASPAYVVGDTVRGEAVYPAGDFDEFTATGVPGETLAAYLRLTAAPAGNSEPYYGLTLEVIDPATGDTVVGRGVQIFGQQFAAIGSFTVPASGDLLIRVRGTGTWGEQLTTAPYEFLVKRGP